jgi:hypothetical protein
MESLPVVSCCCLTYGRPRLLEERPSIRFGEFRPRNGFFVEMEEIYYVYRWGSTGSYHLSGFGEVRIH